MIKSQERNLVKVYGENKAVPIYPSDGENIDRVQKNSSRWKSTRLEGEKPKDLAELIFRMIQGERTFKVDGKIIQSTPQCVAGRKRTIEDIFRIAKYYMPKIKLETVYEAVKSLYNTCISYNYCCTVYRFVHSKMNLRQTISDYRNTMGNKNILF